MKKFKYSEITPEKIYKKRRSFVKSLGFGFGSLTLSTFPLINNSFANIDQNKVTSFKAAVIQKQAAADTDASGPTPKKARRDIAEM